MHCRAQNHCATLQTSDIKNTSFLLDFFLLLTIKWIKSRRMGANVSQLERDIGSDFPANEHYFGLVNVSENRQFSRQCFDFIRWHFLFAVRQHLLFQLGAAGALLLQAISGQSARVQDEEQADEGNAADMSRWFVRNFMSFFSICNFPLTHSCIICFL